jgi:hypothetical protein
MAEINGLVFRKGSEIPLRPRLRRGAAPIAIADNAVKCRGERLGKIWWRGAQWAVTGYGLERLDGRYAIPKERLLEDPAHLWPLHMASKRRDVVDLDEFTTAWMVALLLHGYGGQITPADLRELFATLPP